MGFQSQLFSPLQVLPSELVFFLVEVYHCQVVVSIFQAVVDFKGFQVVVGSLLEEVIAEIEVPQAKMGRGILGV